MSESQNVEPGNKPVRTEFSTMGSYSAARSASFAGMTKKAVQAFLAREARAAERARRRAERRSEIKGSTVGGLE